jgi:hypothetical protein
VASLNLHSAPVTDALVDAPLEAPVDGDAPTARHRGPRSPWWRRASAAPSRGMAYSLGVATVCAMVVIDLAAGDPAATASTQEQSSSIAVADALGIDGAGVDPAATEDPALLGQLAASRSARDEERAAAATVQAKAEQAATAARAAAAAKAAAAAAAKAAAQEAARVAQAAVPETAAVAAAAAPAAVAAAAGTAASVIANISNSAGGVRPQAQAAANKVVSNVPGAAGLTIGGTRASATDPNGHPSGLALDYMVGSDSGLGDAIVAYHIAHWDELGVEYIIWQQRMLSSPGGSWSTMDDRGSSTANHMDHPHVNYR